MVLMQAFAAARNKLATDTWNYVDAHKWPFTPASFQLLILEEFVAGNSLGPRTAQTGFSHLVLPAETTRDRPDA